MVGASLAERVERRTRLVSRLHRRRVDCGEGCLFDLLLDPAERDNVAAENPETLKGMRALLAEFNLHIFNPTRTGGDANLAVSAAVGWGGYLGPWLP